MINNSLRKAERLDKKKLIGQLFEGRGASLSAYPLRVVYMLVEELEVEAAILVSVSKRRFKRAVKRNHVKRQIREAYRKHKQALVHALAERHRHLAIAFIYLSDEIQLSSVIEERMITALARITEKLP